MSRKVGPHHNIWLTRLGGMKPASGACLGSSRHEEAGYTLVALLALMTIVALFAMAAAPSIHQQAQRDREVEAIFRGEQMAEAIRLYYSYQQTQTGPGPASLPNSIDKLIEGLPRGTQKVQVLRKSAARDPLSADGEWRLIRPNSGPLSDFQQSLMLYAENARLITSDPQLNQVQQLMAPPVLPTLGLGVSRPESFDDGDSSGPLIGVSSRSRSKSVINYYGITKHNEWIFTPLFR